MNMKKNGNPISINQVVEVSVLTMIGMQLNSHIEFNNISDINYDYSQ